MIGVKLLGHGGVPVLHRPRTSWEWWQEFDREMAKGKIFDLEKENAVLRKGRSDEIVLDIGEALPQGLAKDVTLVSDIRHQLTEINTKLDVLDDIRERIALQEDDPSFTVAQVAQKLQVSSTKVYQLTESGKLRSYKTGNQVRIKASHIREYQDRHTRVAEAKKKRKSGSFDKSEADRLFGPGWDA